MLRTDLKIYKSERMTQQADAGGQRTSNEVLNGQLNEVFGNISDIDHAQSAVDIAKVYPAVATNDTQLLQDGHLLINEPPLDPLVDVLLVESARINDGSMRTDIIEAIESSLVPSLALRTGLSEMVAGQDQIAALDLTQAAAFSGEQPTVTLRRGGIYAISVEYTGLEDAAWPRFTHFIKVTAIEPDFVRFEPPLPYPAPGRGRLVNSQTRCTVLRDTTAGSGVVYHGVTQLTANASGTTLNVERTSGRVTPNITEAVERQANKPFAATDTGLIKKRVDIPAVGVTYSIPVPDFIELNGNNAFVVVYVSAGIEYSQSFNATAINAGQFEFAIQRTPDADTNVQVQYFSSDRYSTYTFPAVIPAGFTLLPATIVGGVLRAADNKRYSLRQDGSDPNRFNVWVNNATTNLTQLAVIIDPADGTPTYFNGYSELQYDAVLEDDTATGESATAAEFVLPFGQVLPGTFYMSVELVSGGLLSASGDSNGDIAGTNVSGNINGNLVTLAFTQPVKLSTLQYNINEVVQLVPPQSLYGINQLRLPNGGKVPLFRPFGTICVANNEFQQFAALTPAQTIARRPNSFVDIVDSTGSSLWHPLNSYFEYDKATGEVTIVDASGFTPPFELVDTLSELALVTGVTDTTLKITQPLKNSYAAGSIVSSVFKLGDMQARVTNLFDQTTWDGNFEDTIQGTPAPANYNNIDYPIELVNQSAVNERWAIHFLSDTSFRCVGQNVGQVATGDTLNDFAPINPATNQPYFVIRAAGWGGGWQPSNVVRFNTVSASPPAVLMRSVAAGHSDIEQDSIRLHFRGNAQ
jgi:hypothetical protein